MKRLLASLVLVAACSKPTPAPVVPLQGTAPAAPPAEPKVVIAEAEAPDETGDIPLIEATCEEATQAWGATTPSDEGTFHRKLLDSAVTEGCDDHQWSAAVRGCLQRAVPGSPEPCLEQLATAQRDDLAARLAAADTRRLSVLTASKKTASITCDKLVAKHYADATWKDVSPDVTGKARTKMIAEARASLKTACTKDTWSAFGRACVISDGDPACFSIVNSSAAQWSRPPLVLTSMPSTGIPECDLYGAAIQKLASCDKIPAESRRAIRDAFLQAAAAFKSIPPDHRAAAAEACNAATAAVTQAGTACR